METGKYSGIKKGAGRSNNSEEVVERVRVSLVRSSTKSVCTATRQLNKKRLFVHKVLRKHLRLYAFKMQ